MCDPQTILALVQEGVDFFESSYVYHVTDLGHALTFANTLQQQPSSCIYIDLNDQQLYKNDFGPILEGCSCYTCRKHTRGYINHLLATKELLARVLLVMHNLHHYGVLFQTIRQAIAQDKLSELYKSCVH